ncbi:MAG TPA: hypothetical protein VN963_03040, partial [bacterium]|nr:hypothetical protein [bacterium]
LKEAALAQTSGITTDGQKLYFVDSETSSLRSVGLPPSGGGVTTFIGSGLFDFGDKDGAAGQAMLQHPIGITYHDGLLYLADTYNNKIKVFNPQTRVIKTLLGGAKAGYGDGPAAQSLFNEPCGLAFARNKLFIADTNNNLIRVFDPQTSQVSTLEITGLEKLNPMKTTAFTGEKVTLEAQKVQPGVKELQLEISLPADRELNAQAPSRYEISSSNVSTVHLGVSTGEVKSTTITIPVSLQAGQAELSVTLHLYYCSHGQEALCYFKEVQLLIPIIVDKVGQTLLKTNYVIRQ